MVGLRLTLKAGAIAKLVELQLHSLSVGLAAVAAGHAVKRAVQRMPDWHLRLRFPIERRIRRVVPVKLCHREVDYSATDLGTCTHVNLFVYLAKF